MNTILVIADADLTQTVALKQALELATAFDAKLHIAYFYFEDIRGLGLKGREFKHQKVEQLDHKARTQQQELNLGPEHSYEIVWRDDLSEWACQFAKEHQPIFVLKTGHQSKKLLNTPTDWRLIRDCPTPLFIVCEKLWQKDQNVLACIDLQTTNEDKKQLNRQILEHAKQLANLLGKQLHIGFSPTFSVVMKDLGIKSKKQTLLDAINKLTPELEQLCRTYNISMDHIHIKAGQPGLVLPSIAAEIHASIVVIGSSSHRGLTEQFIGDTAEKALELLKTHVVVLKLAG
ncbi:universal stress protein [Thalassotalea aquiviva]|uniref:universal stress protein n=1 Tax=Thalassotalea aquiviva TaxID=3242415 RepID=UPI00352B0C22